VQQVLEALAEPQRRRIVELLGDREVLVGELVSELGLRQPTVSKHLKVMREAGMVVCRADAQRRWYRLRADSLRELDEWLEPYRRQWSHRLDALQRHLDEMEDE
jgi:DNA-binding transcriptional ArsR family regulator